MSRRPLGILLSLILVLSSETPAHAFWSMGKVVHQDITRDALGRVLYSFVPGSAFPYPFSSRALAAINAAHKEADSPLSTYNAADHFDSESFAASYELLANRYQQMRALLRTRMSLPGERMWRLYGLMLHQVQDFYSHSTWVAAGNRDIVNFGKYLAKDSTPALILMPGAIGAACDASGIEVLRPVRQVTTGYYNVARPPGKCEHGTVQNSAVGCYFPVTGPNGINLDTDCRDPAAFAIARNLAVQESIALTLALIKDVYDRWNDESFYYRPFCSFVDSNRRYTMDCD